MTAAWGIDGPRQSTVWSQASVTPKILADDHSTRGLPVPLEWAQTCAGRVQDMRKELRKRFVGMDLDDNRGNLLDWALACLIARENLLLLGPPGVAKTEIAESIFRLQGLIVPEIRDLPSMRAKKEEDNDYTTWWTKRENEERQKHKYFRYLLSRFTQPEELFGPIEIGLLRQGMLVHVNFGLLTSPGVRGAFLDEIFKASSSILNALLTLVLEREYFNWGGMRRSDLVMFIGASNELPGGLATGTVGVGAGGEDFNLLYAFLDRFPLRLEIPNVSGSSSKGKHIDKALQSDLFEASNKALGRERDRFVTGETFPPTHPASVNDILLLGRAILDSAIRREPSGDSMFSAAALERFRKEFYEIAASLQAEGTGLHKAHISWTISPRKLKALYKIALAHAIVADENFPMAGRNAVVSGPHSRELHVFDFIWDTHTKSHELRDRVAGLIGKRQW